MISVILDANALIMPFQFSLNLDSELERLFGNHEIYVPSSVISELKGLGRKDALSLSQKYEEIKVSKKGDEGVLQAAEILEGVIVTNDKELKKRSLDRNFPVAYLRSSSHLQLIGEKIYTGEAEENKILLKGEVSSGVGEGSYFLSLEGYRNQLKKKFDIEPYEGTLNIRIYESFLSEYNKLKKEEGKILGGFEEEGKVYGTVKCFRCQIDKIDCLLIIPEKSRYEKVAEIISEVKLRDRLGLEDGEEVKIVVHT